MSDLIERQAVIDALTKTSGIRGDALKALYDLPPVSTEKTGWWEKAKSEIRCGENKAYNADFTMGCEYAIGVIERMFEEQVSTEKTGRWEKTRYRSVDQTGETYDDGNALRCSECAHCFKTELLWVKNYCPNCGAKMEVEE